MSQRRQAGLYAVVEKGLMTAALTVMAAGTGIAQNASAVITDASKAIGADAVKTIQYSGSAAEYNYGQAYTNGGPWPVWRDKTYTRVVDFEARAIKIDRVAEPRDWQRRGGGLQPAPTQTVIVQANTPLVQQAPLLLSPYAALKEAAASNATVKSETVAGKKLTVLTYTGSNKAKVNVYVDDKHMVDRVETWFDNAVSGDTLIQENYSDYKDVGGVKVPMRIVEKQGSFPTLELTVTDVKVNEPANIPAPPAGRGGAGAGGGQPAAATSRKLGDGVYLILPAYAAIAVDFKDYIVVIEPGNSEARANAIIEEVKKDIPNKPIRYVVNTHPHFDHSSGLRRFVAEGATILTNEKNKAYLEKVLSQPHTLNPDKQEQVKAKLTIETVGSKKVLTDGTHVIELYRLQDNLHHEAELAAYLPNEKVLLEADGFLPPAQADATTPNPFDPNHLLNDIRLFKLNVATIVPVHYPADLRVVTIEELTKRAAAQAAQVGSR
jgi:glyoxylase-like metal-dependent hydrolase (beta-lactamase superfamily II)